MRHFIHDGDTGEPITDSDGNRIFWSDSDGDWSPEHHQTVYTETPGGSREVKDVHFDPENGSFHKK